MVGVSVRFTEPLCSSSHNTLNFVAQAVLIDGDDVMMGDGVVRGVFSQIDKSGRDELEMGKGWQIDRRVSGVGCR